MQFGFDRTFFAAFASNYESSKRFLNIVVERKDTQTAALCVC